MRWAIQPGESPFSDRARLRRVRAAPPALRRPVGGTDRRGATTRCSTSWPAPAGRDRRRSCPLAPGTAAYVAPRQRRGRSKTQTASSCSRSSSTIRCRPTARPMPSWRSTRSRAGPRRQAASSACSRRPSSAAARRRSSSGTSPSSARPTTSISTTRSSTYSRATARSTSTASPRRFAPGTCVHLPAGLVHCLENVGPGEMRVLGVFRPAGSPAEAYYPDGTAARYPY